MLFGGGVTAHVPSWAALIILVGALATALTAMAMFTMKVLIPAVRGFAAITENLRVMADIAERFGNQGHETISAELRALAANDEVSAANQKAILARLDAVSSKTELIDSRLSQTRHDIIGEFAGLKTGPAGAATLVEAIERTSVDLQQVRIQLAELADKPMEAP